MGRRRVNKVERFEYMTREALARDEAKNRIERILFDLFNPNGAVAIFNESYDELTRAVEEKLCAGGALLAYDGDFYINALNKFITTKKYPSDFDSVYYGEELIKLAFKIEAFLREKRQK